MLGYLTRRLAITVVVLLGLAVAAFLVIHLVPGDPVAEALGGRATPATIRQARHQLGLDRPLLVQLWNFIVNAVQGKFGTSLTFEVPVTQLIGSRIAPSVFLIGYGLIVAIVLGVPLAVIAALRPNGIVDHVVRVVATFAFAMPTFWLGLVLALLLGQDLGWFPVAGYRTGFGGLLSTLTIPALVLGLSLAVIIIRTLRSNLLEVLQSEYIEAARARGYSETRLVCKHAMRNAVIPTINILAVAVGYLIGGTVVIETVFQIPGIGSLLVQAVTRRDYELVQALALLAGSAVVLLNLATDLLQLVIDPRVRLAGRR